MARKKITRIPIQLTELEDGNYHILIEAELKNEEKVYWAIDTGASKSVFDSNLHAHYLLTQTDNTEVQSAGIGENPVDTQVGELLYLKVGEIQMNEWPVALIDLSYVNKVYGNFSDSTLVGLLGSDFLVKYDAVIDFRKLELKLYY